jgi:hypothetical protein
MKSYFLFVLVALTLSACGPVPRSTDIPDAPSQAVQSLTFEDRMAIRARLTVIRSEAKAEAKAQHDPFVSQDEAEAYEVLVGRLNREKRQVLLDEYRLTEADLDAIVQEYLKSQGANVREN